ncbi:MAG: glutamate synthase large subunit [Kiritimatiellae bacterium]|nr:glutamate synthase large subunit [Kiritimatiellia bacterium]
MSQSESSLERRQAYAARGLYAPDCEHDNCGVGFLVNINGEPTHAIIERGIEVLKNLLHRGATGADMNTGDGAGLLFQMPDRFFREECERLKLALPEPGGYGVGMLFLPQGTEARARCRELLAHTTREEGLSVIGWRDVPVDGRVLGEQARREQPVIAQCLVAGGHLGGAALERKLLVIRKQAQRRAAECLGPEDRFYVASLSARTLVYKGLMMATQVPGFYGDLADPSLETALAVVHQRYSTNTFPSWELAQPFRFLAHNGEINTLRGNRNQIRAREQDLESELFGADIAKVLPILEAGASDSASLDNVLELLTLAGRALHHAMVMLIPQAWGVKYPIGPDLRGFFEYHAGLMEPWDGPAAVAFTDGRRVGALLDRNGLRPARYTVLRDGFMVFASEAGVLDFPAEQVAEKGALRPGQILMVDLDQKRLLKDVELKMRLARAKPYRRWVEENKIDVHALFNAVAPVAPDTDTLFRRLSLFGYTREDLDVILGTMAETGHEPVGSMGADQPLAVLSEKPQLLTWYFKQVFAQVTNPAIDPIREELVMSLMTFLGNSPKILTESPQQARLVKMQHPFLANEDLERLRTLNLPDFRCVTLPMGFPALGGGRELEEALETLCRRAESAVGNGYRILVLSDRDLPEHRTPIPALLAVSAVNRHLIRRGMRTSVGVVAETGEAREVMHMAVLLGFGASAINPYLAFEIVSDMALKGQLGEKVSVPLAIENYIEALGKGLLKVMSKLGISTLRSYRSAQVFEAVGLNKRVVDKYFEGTPSRIGGIGLAEIAREANARYEAAWHRDPTRPPVLPSGGQYRYRRDGERHLWTPETISLLQRATRENDPVLYEQYAERINNQAGRLSTLRGLFRFKPAEPVPLGEVEPAAEIVKRFVTGAMSFGSISRETHETLAVAMNRLGAMSNSGEGGEDPARYAPLPNGDSRASATKQVASGRFGVTAEYLVHARDLQIKIAQGAKPGEGGQLPGHKVNAEIARVRNSTPGVTLISPPPHHDIYSIEDIAQLIYDLKNANPAARISVKLVSEIGVGTVAAGVAKGRADMILISGYDGGTGASPLSSIKHAGVPWELGLSETQQTLVLNGLRSRVRLQVDGQIKTGRDVVVGALLGAEEFGFATTALVVCGCVMMRKCHNNTCPVGVATQDPELRKRFSGKPEYVQNFFRMIAEEVRRFMAQMGFRKMDEMIGRVDRLEMNAAISFWKARGLDFSRILYQPAAEPHEVRCTTTQEHGLEQALDNTILPKVEKALEKGKRVTLKMPIRNVHRTVGAMTSCRLVGKYGAAGLPDDTVTIEFTGAAGQSFGAFCCKGMTLVLNGEANDYLGKGLSGAKIIVRPYPGATYDPAANIAVGNVLLYGATGGEVYVNGRAGERFAIRNSGACAVVEGVGDHGCEYMTGGRVVILGPTGVNFGAGMSGGIAYVYDETGVLDDHSNLDMIDLEIVEDPADEQELRDMIERHVRYTGSPRAKHILENWAACLPRFIKVFPMEYRRALGRMSREDEATEREEMRIA